VLRAVDPAAILLFAGASFFFALAETALFSLSKWQVGHWRKNIRARAKSWRLLERPQDLLATLALGNTFANAAMLAVALAWFSTRTGRWPDDDCAGWRSCSSAARFFPKTWRCGSRNAGRCASAGCCCFPKDFHAFLSRGAMAERGI
jgi:hypothetical protein